MSDSEIEEYLVRLDNEVLNFKDRLFNISWHMRGGVTMHELLHVYSEDDLGIMDNIIKQHIDLTKETKMPLL
jgi:hypothetical protein